MALGLEQYGRLWLLGVQSITLVVPGYVSWRTMAIPDAT
jgi:hypothetical protein